MDVSIIIVNYNTKQFLYNCITSIYKNTRDLQYEIIVSDNGSRDGSIEMIRTNFPDVRLIENNKNIGFGAANNRALDISKGKYVFYLNSDTILLNNAINYFYGYWENQDDPEKLGALGCNLLNVKQVITNSWGFFFRFQHDFLRFTNEYFHLILATMGYKRKRRPATKRLGEVDVIIGAALFLLNNQDARFDEYFFLYHEETDLELQLSKKNKKRMLIDGPEIVHLEGGSNQTNISTKKYVNYISFSRIHDNLSRIKYYRKNKTNPISIFLLKFAIFVIWSYPPIIKVTYKYWKTLWSI